MIFRFAQCELNSKLVELRRNNQPVAIEPQVFRLLVLLLKQKNQVLSKDTILSTIWADRVVADSSLSSCIKAARQAIGDSGEQQKLIKTIRGHGFRFVGKVIIEPQDAEAMANSTPELPSQTSSNKVIPLKQHNTPLSGRKQEQLKLNGSVEQSLTGKEQVLLLSGSAGVGKSRLLEEVSNYAANRNMRILWGRCKEETGAPAYWPWRQLLCNHFQDQKWLSVPDAPELANLLPALFPEQTDLPSSTQQSSDQYRFNLFHSIASLLSHALQEQPLLLIFDDLHRADQASLSLLEFIASELTNKCACIMGTYRDTDLTPGHRFYATLSELSRLPHFDSLTLKHLSKSDVQDWVISELPNTPAQTINDVISRTDGHPLYISETIRHLQQGGDPSKLPTSLKAIISQRFAHLPNDCLEVLRAASVIGRRFDLGTLSEVLTSQPVKILSKLDHAVIAGQLEAQETPGHYQFSHILIRETLYDSLLNSDRLHLHCNLAKYLEKQQADHGLIALHYHQAAPLGMATQSTYFANLAAKEAYQLLAYEISVKYYQLALQTAQAAEKLNTLLCLGQSQIKAGEIGAAIITFDSAIKLAEQSASYDSYAQAAIGMEEATWRPGLNASKVMHHLEYVLEKVSNEKTKVEVICSLVRAKIMCGKADKDNALIKQARRYLDNIEDPLVEAKLLLAELVTNSLQQYSLAQYQQRINKAKKAAQITKDLGHDSLFIEVLSWHMQDLVVCGKMAEVERLITEQLQLGLATKQPFFRYYTIMWRSLFCTARGEFKKSQQYAQVALEMCRWLPGLDGEGVYGFQMFAIKREQGQLMGLSHLVEKFVRETHAHTHWKPGLALIYTDMGELKKAQLVFEELLASNFSELPKDAMWLTCIAYLCEVCHQLGHLAAAKILYDTLLPHQGFNILVGANICTLGSVDRYLGLLAMTSQQFDLAEQHLSKAIVQNKQQGLTVSLAHCQYDLACVLSHRKMDDDRQLAQTLIDEVLTFSHQVGMLPLNNKALTLRQKVRSGPEAQALDKLGLSKREHQVLCLIAKGKQNKDIAETLFISPNTVAAHIRNILEKTGASNRTEAANLVAEPPPSLE